MAVDHQVTVGADRIAYGGDARDAGIKQFAIDALMAIAIQLDSVERRDLDCRKAVFDGTPRMRLETVRRSLCNTPIDIGINRHAIPPPFAKQCADTGSVLLCGEIPYG